MSCCLPIRHGATALVAALAVFTSAVTAAEKQPVTLAIVIAKDANAPNPEVEPLLFAQLATLESVRLVEREQITKALDELKLSAAGLADTESVLKLGKLASADALVMVDQAPEPPTLRVRMVE